MLAPTLTERTGEACCVDVETELAESFAVQEGMLAFAQHRRWSSPAFTPEEPAQGEKKRRTCKRNVKLAAALIFQNRCLTLSRLPCVVVALDGRVFSMGATTHLPGLGALMGTSDCAGHMSTPSLTASARRHGARIVLVEIQNKAKFV